MVDNTQIEKSVKTNNALRKNIKSGHVDFVIILCILILFLIGLVMIFSASMYTAGVNPDINDSFYYVRKQFIFGIIGIAGLIFISRIDYRITKQFAPVVLGICIILLILVLIPGIGHFVNGGRRWILLPGIGTIQPSEFTKIALILYLAYSIEKKANLIRTFRYGFLPYIILIGVVCGLIAMEPNMSTAVIIAAMVLGILFIGGVKMTYLLPIVGVAVAAAAAMIIFTPWRLDRLLTYLDPFADITGDGWQIAQSLMALGSGGIFGQGLGNGKAKLMFMPEPQNDFIFASIGEEIGLIGCLAILFIYMILIWRCVKVSMEAPDTFSTIFAAGMALLIGMQVFINVAVVTNLIPVTGMPLPFISAGSSSVISLMCGMGVVLNISKRCNMNN